MWGEARVQVNALSREILSHLDQGMPVSKIYQQLIADGRVTIKKSAFYAHVNKLRRDQHSGRVGTTLPAALPAPLPSPSPKPSAPSRPIPPARPRPSASAGSGGVRPSIEGIDPETLKRVSPARFQELWEGEASTSTEGEDQ